MTMQESIANMIEPLPKPTLQQETSPTSERSNAVKQDGGDGSGYGGLERDAARYRWLRDSHCMEDLPQVYADDDCNTWLTGAELDAAIDAAMLNAIQPCKSDPET